MTVTQTAAPAIEDVLALSPLQHGLFSLAGLSHADGQGAADPYVIAMAATVSGVLDVGLLRVCAQLMLHRHPNLRASFLTSAGSKPVQVIPSRVEVPWRVIEATADQVPALEAAERSRPFDISRGPLIRFLVIELPNHRWHLVIVAHHIVIDGWSLPLFVAELMTLYSAGGDSTALPARPRPYRDYIGWLATRDQVASRKIWADHLSGLDGPTLLTPALAATAPDAGLPQRTEIRLDRETTRTVTAAARARGVTLNTVVQLAWATLLSSMTDRADVVFGVTVSGRPDQLSGVETMIGLFVNTVPLRVQLKPAEAVGAQCLSLQSRAAALREHSYLSHSELRAIGGVGELFDTLLVYENFPSGALGAGTAFDACGARFEPVALESLSHFPVTIAAHMTDDELVVLVETLDGALGSVSPTELGERLLTVTQRLLRGWDTPLREIDLLLAAENGPEPTTTLPRSSTGIHTRITELAAQRPQAPALSWDGGELTYAELDSRANRFAAVTFPAPLVPETPVAIILPRGPRYVVAMLAVLKAGGVIVPLDPSMPAERITDILGQAGITAPHVIDEARLAGLPHGWETVADCEYTPFDTQPGQAAYTVFTSGTTGRPKGVIGTHDALLAYGADHITAVLQPAAQRLGRPLRIAHAWSFTFDAAWQPLAALLDGHCVHIVGSDTQRDAEALVAMIDRFGIDMIDTTPSMFTQLRNAGLLTQVPIAVLAMGGEAVEPAMWQSIRAICSDTGLHAYNCYGPTETTVEAVVAAIGTYPNPSIGTPTVTTRAYVLDSWLRPVPHGAPGELYLAGGQLTRGYLHRATETSSRFVADLQVPGERMYRTGDVVRRTASGGLQFLGRSDDQVKIRGYRVEPGEITAVLTELPQVHGAHITVRLTNRGPRLIAYLATDQKSLSVNDIRAALAPRLPRYLMPHQIIMLNQLPLTAHGKIDETALAAIDIETPAAVAPQTPTEVALAQILTEVLQTPQGDITADFLELGLDSIVALSVVQLARRRGIALRARLLRDCTSIAELAAAVDADTAADAIGTPDADTTGPIPVLPNLHWLYEYGNPRRLAQTEAIRLPADITGAQLHTMLSAVIAGHEVLRTRLDRDDRMLVPAEVSLTITEVAVTGSLTDAVTEYTAAGLEALDPEAGRMLTATWLRPATGPGVLLLSAHVIAMDPASWRIVLGELDAAWHTIAAGRDPAPIREATSYRRWSAALTARSETLDTEAFWCDQLRGPDPLLGTRRVRPDTDRAASLSVSMVMADSAVTARLLAGPVPVTDLLAQAAAMMITAWRRGRGQDASIPLLAVETHGRAEELLPGADTTDTVGLFSAIYPVRVHPDRPGLPVDAVTGIDYGLLRYLRADTAERLAAHPEPQVLLNYLGRVHAGGDTGVLIPDRMLLAGLSLVPEPELAVRHELTLTVGVITDADGPVLATQWRTLPDILDADAITELQALWLNALREVVR